MKITSNSYQLSILVPKLLMDSLDEFIKNGNGYDIVASKKFRRNHPKSNLLDISRSGLLRFIVTYAGDFDGDNYTREAELINQQLIADDRELKYYTIRTNNPIILRDRHKIQYRLVTAMVYMGIPILNYFDGEQIKI